MSAADKPTVLLPGCLLYRSDSRRRRGDVQQQAARERQRQVAQFNRMQKQENKCVLCFKSPARNEHLAIAVGQSSYLSLMPRGKLVEGHCCIVTQEHVPSMRQVGRGLVVLCARLPTELQCILLFLAAMQSGCGRAAPQLGPWLASGVTGPA